MRLPDIAAKEIFRSVRLDELELRDNVRKHFDEAGLESLKASIERSGVLVPIRARQVGAAIVVTDGERRIRACRLAGLMEIPTVITQRDLDSEELCVEQFITNCQREGLSPLEMAQALAQLKTAAGLNAAQVAAKVGFSPSKVSRLLGLLEMPPEIQAQVESGAIPLTAAAELCRLNDAEREAMLEQVAQGHVSRDALVGSRKQRAQVQPATASKMGRATAVLGQGRSVTLQAAGLDLEVCIELLQELLEKARKARPQGLGLSTFLRVLKETSKDVASEIPRAG